MALEKHDILMKEALCLWSILESVGIDREAIDLGYDPDTNSVEIIITTPAQDHLFIRIGSTDFSVEETAKRFESAWADWSSGGISTEELDAFYEKSETKNHISSLLSELACASVGPLSVGSVAEN